MPAARSYPQIPSVDSNENSTMPGPSMSVENRHCLPSKMSQRCKALGLGQVPRRAPYCGPDQRQALAAACLSPVGPGLGTRAVAVVSGGRGRRRLAVIITQTAHALFHFLGDQCLVMSVSTV